jgi:hypothetical protein
MPYYVVGDYYGRGDYYRGDGFLSGLGSLIKGAARTALGFLPGGSALNTGIDIVTGAVSAPKSKSDVAAAAIAGQAMQTSNIVSTISALAPGMPGMMAGPSIMAPGAPFPTLGMAGGGTMPASMFARGYRWNKSTYAVRGGGTSRWGPATGQIMLIPKHTVAVKSRRMNVANPRALRRGLRRAAGFVKLARRAHVRLAAFTGRGKKKKK